MIRWGEIAPADLASAPPFPKLRPSALGQRRNRAVASMQSIRRRKKLSNASGGRDYIETVWGRGYMLREACDEDAAPIAAAV